MGTEYRTPKVIRTEAEFHLNRTSPAVSGGWADDTGALEAAFRYGPNPPEGIPPPTGSSAPGSVRQKPRLRFLSLLVLPLAAILIAAGAVCLRRKQTGEDSTEVDAPRSSLPRLPPAELWGSDAETENPD